MYTEELANLNPNGIFSLCEIFAELYSCNARILCSVVSVRSRTPLKLKLNLDHFQIILKE